MYVPSTRQSRGRHLRPRHNRRWARWPDKSWTVNALVKPVSWNLRAPGDSSPPALPSTTGAGEVGALRRFSPCAGLVRRCTSPPRLTRVVNISRRCNSGRTWDATDRLTGGLPQGRSTMAKGADFRRSRTARRISKIDMPENLSPGVSRRVSDKPTPSAQKSAGAAMLLQCAISPATLVCRHVLWRLDRLRRQKSRR